MAISDIALDPSGTAPAPSRAKTLVLYLSIAYGVLCLVSAVYLVLTELATPSSLWLKENRLFDASPMDKAIGTDIAEWFPAQGVHTRHARCDSDRRDALAAGDFKSLPAIRLRCVMVIEDALKSMPASPSLWFHHARLLAEAGAGDAAVERSLRLSYRMGAREGWLAPARLKFGLFRWELLPADLRIRVETDARTMLQSWLLLKTLARLHWSNPALRKQLDQILERSATTEQKSTFYWLAGKLQNNERLP